MLGTSTAKNKSYLDPKTRSSEVLEFESELRQKIVGQENAVRQLVETYQVYTAGMTMPDRPIANLLFLGPTGTGKTRIVEAAAEILFRDPRAFIKIDCAEFQHSHEIAKLTGSPPGYIGHRETPPVLTQNFIDGFQTAKNQFTFILFDEIEKASEAFWKLLLGILDKGKLTLGDNRKVDLSRTVICMTSNLGARQMSELLSGGIGFVPAAGSRPEQRSSIGQRLHRTALDAANRYFSPEFMNRLDKVIVFENLGPADLDAILDIELSSVQKRVLALGSQPFVLQYTRRASRFLLREGTDAAYGARHLKRAIERYVVFPLSNLIASGQTANAAVIKVDVRSGGRQLVFSKLDQVPWLEISSLSSAALEPALVL